MPETVKTKWCLLCNKYFEYCATREHNCFHDIDTSMTLCKYKIVNIDERSTVVYYCVYCARTTKYDQPVICLIRGDPDLESVFIERPYFCRNISCKYHPTVQAIFCPTHPAYNTATIIEYGEHSFSETATPRCYRCKKDKSVLEYAPYCNNNCLNLKI